MNRTASPDPQEEQLDSEIISIRAEIRKLQRRKRFLSSSLLSSEPIQKHLRKPTPALSSIHDDNASISPLVRAAGEHSASNHHRIAFGTTTFPFKDPSPTTTAADNPNLLGVRIDVCARNGQFTKPYYVLLRRERGRAEQPKRLRVHKHTIPTFISMAKLESVYLPTSRVPRQTPDDNEENENEEGGSDAEATLKPWKPANKTTRKQDLRAFVRELRRELVAWHVRTDAIELLRERLGLAHEGESAPNRSGIVSLSPTALEAHYVRLEWEDGRVGRFKLSHAGLVERAVVIGDDGRDKQTEDAMTGGGGRVEALLDRLSEPGIVMSGS
ncbi:hypothetical protein NUU61_000584 [Penicillium alfredii]|uniref:Centromere protein Cenp-O n=1 Tax=Penicillium alfredii TaxID=1506179 RepID=A0A9W9KQT7_9EURO|nr:uncharacterized protein NUU61_000584 [Penicillium alfredii]KAJ5114825.1 hypothetical protein NUU61_000584 [Penicillium alfredii]